MLPTFSTTGVTCTSTRYPNGRPGAAELNFTTLSVLGYRAASLAVFVIAFQHLFQNCLGFTDTTVDTGLEIDFLQSSTSEAVSDFAPALAVLFAHARKKITERTHAQ